MLVHAISVVILPDDVRQCLACPSLLYCCRFLLNLSPLARAPPGQLRVCDLVGSLREYAHVDPHVAYHLWVLVFPIVWATLQKAEQINLAKPIISLMSKEYHQRQASGRPNVMQAMLEAISLSQPQPKIPPGERRFFYFF